MIYNILFIDLAYATGSFNKLTYFIYTLIYLVTTWSSGEICFSRNLLRNVMSLSSVIIPPTPVKSELHLQATKIYIG